VDFAATALPWLALFAAALTVWRSAWHGPTLTLLGAAFAAALYQGVLDSPALLPIALLAASAWAVRDKRPAFARYAGHVVFIGVAAALALHLLPGFHNPRVIGPVRYTPDALPFSMYLNLDKPLAGFWLMLALPWIPAAREPRAAVMAGVIALLFTTLACLLLAGGLGLVAWAPKMPDSAPLWLLNNLLLVAFTEEALFRGYIQGGLARLLQCVPRGETLALFAAAVLFGAAHLAGGWQWAVVAACAGLGYGLAYRHGGLAAAVLAHVGLNAAHFFLFTYPMLQPGA
jgi:membrane protease YdiL (CAAX protease family)